MNVLILGGSGMLGHKIFQHLRSRNTDTWCTIRSRLSDPSIRRIALLQSGHVIENVDAMDIAAVERMISDMTPQVIVNCIGMVKQRPEAISAVKSITLNALLPHKLAYICAKWGGRLIHFSTDCVFSGLKGYYREEDVADAIDLYGRSKLLGEVSIRNALTLRTSIVGRELSHFASLLEWLIAHNGTTILGYTRALYSGVTTNYMAELVARLIEEQPMISGLHQITSSTLSKFELLQLFRDAYNLNIEIVPDGSFVCNRSMIGDAFVRATGYSCPIWKELVNQLAADTTPYMQWRQETT